MNQTFETAIELKSRKILLNSINPCFPTFAEKNDDPDTQYNRGEGRMCGTSGATGNASTFVPKLVKRHNNDKNLIVERIFDWPRTVNQVKRKEKKREV